MGVGDPRGLKQKPDPDKSQNPDNSIKFLQQEMIMEELDEFVP